MRRSGTAVERGSRFGDRIVARDRQSYTSDRAKECNARNAAYNNDDLDTAIAHYTKAIELKPDYAAAYFNRGAAYAGKELSDQAIADFT